MCYAVRLAFDSASDPVYATGWQEGDAGGTGFGPWSFDGTSIDLVYGAAPAHQIDNGLQTGSQNSSPYNNIGRAWTIYNFNGSAVGPSNLPQDATDFTRAGRALPAPLQAGQTISVVIDNPIERRFKRGYSINLNSGGGNVCFNGESCTPGVSPVIRWDIGTFEYFSDGQWGNTTLNDQETDAGMRIDFTLTGSNSFRYTMTPLDNPSLAWTSTGNLPAGNPIDWIQFQLNNTDSDFYPNIVAGPQATDFYIRSLEVTGPGVPGDYNDNGLVDAADYVVWRKYQGTNFQLTNEVSGVSAGSVTQADHDAWRARYGNTSGSAAGSAWGPLPVPEPGASVLVMASVAGIIFVRHRPTRRTRKPLFRILRTAAFSSPESL